MYKADSLILSPHNSGLSKSLSNKISLWGTSVFLSSQKHYTAPQGHTKCHIPSSRHSTVWNTALNFQKGTVYNISLSYLSWGPHASLALPTSLNDLAWRLQINFNQCKNMRGLRGWADSSGVHHLWYHHEEGPSLHARNSRKSHHDCV